MKTTLLRNRGRVVVGRNTEKGEICMFLLENKSR